MNPNTLGRYLRTFRQNKGLTGQAVSEITKIPQSRICHIELGYVRSPSVNLIKKLSVFLDKTPLELAEMVDLKSFAVRAFIEEETKS